MGIDKKVAVIIAGGKSSRMQRDKALLPFAGFSTLAEYQYERLSLYFDKVYISAKSNKFDFSVELIEDRYEASSPLVAIVSIFETLEMDEVFILSVDAPFISIEIIESLYKQAESSMANIIVAKSSRGIEPLCAIYRRTVLPLAKEFISQDKHRLGSLFDKLEIEIIEFTKEREFSNLNYPSDYKNALLLDSL